MSADSGLMQEIDKIYHKNETSEGRINHITDFVVSREAALQARVAELETFLNTLADGPMCENDGMGCPVSTDILKFLGRW